MDKSIQKVLLLYQLFLLLVLLFLFFFNIQSAQLFIFLILVPILIYIFSEKGSKYFLMGFAGLLVTWLIILLYFRLFRNFFPIPRIGEEKIVGFAHYYGYPFYFDTVMFFIFILSPLILVVFTKFFIGRTEYGKNSAVRKKI